MFCTHSGKCSSDRSTNLDLSSFGDLSDAVGVRPLAVNEMAKGRAKEFGDCRNVFPGHSFTVSDEESFEKFECELCTGSGGQISEESHESLSDSCLIAFADAQLEEMDGEWLSRLSEVSGVS